ncbi:MAG: hypothetical protein AAF754_18225 [Pseudomonadota bacterium]
MTEDFEELSQEASERKRMQDLKDLNDELAGRETGRIKRFLGDTPADDPSSPNNRRRASAISTLDQLMISDPIYRDMHHRTSQALAHAQNRLDQARDRIASMRQETEAEIEDMKARAARLPDGSAVFRDKNGAVRREDGSIVDQALADTILWRGDEPSYEDWKATNERLERLEEMEREVEAAQQEIGEMQDRLQDADNPPSLEELEDMQAQADDILSGLESDLGAMSAEPTESPSQNPAGPTEPAVTDTFQP